MDRYDVRQELGEGTFGTVFLAIHKTTNQEVRKFRESTRNFSVESKTLSLHKSRVSMLAMERLDKSTIVILIKHKA